MDNAICRKVTVGNRQGIHLRPAYLIAELAGKYESDINLEADGNRVNGKSVLEIIGLAAGQGTELNVHADGPDASQAIDAIVQLVDQGFPGEEAAQAENGKMAQD
ncbi:MAG: HPr family phosphocarrier protein [Planctomycetota bacterium]|nr:HPr family phosphocarrier protein [Planctomycetota bacterium]